MSRKQKRIKPRRLPPLGRKMSITKLCAALGISPKTFKRQVRDFRKFPTKRYGQYEGYQVSLLDIMSELIFTVATAAPLLGLTRSQTFRAIREGRLLAHRPRHYYGNFMANRIMLGEILRFREENSSD